VKEAIAKPAREPLPAVIAFLLLAAAMSVERDIEIAAHQRMLDFGSFSGGRSVL